VLLLKASLDNDNSISIQFSSIGVLKCLPTVVALVVRVTYGVWSSFEIMLAVEKEFMCAACKCGNVEDGENQKIGCLAV
jgi:hypothetical protein